MPAPQSSPVPNRCRLTLVLTSDQILEFGQSAGDLISAAFAGGDIAVVTLAQMQFDDEAFLPLIQPLIPVIQSAGAAAIIAGTPRVASRAEADGIQFSQDIDAVRDGVSRLAPLMIGAGNIRTRHAALEIGEAEPDFVMFGKPGDDSRPAPRERNLQLGEWWASLVEIPCIVLGGTDWRSAETIASTRADFVALSNAIFAPDNGDRSDQHQIEKMVRDVNALLDEKAPALEPFSENS